MAQPVPNLIKLEVLELASFLTLIYPSLLNLLPIHSLQDFLQKSLSKMYLQTLLTFSLLWIFKTNRLYLWPTPIRNPLLESSKVLTSLGPPLLLMLLRILSTRALKTTLLIMTLSQKSTKLKKINPLSKLIQAECLLLVSSQVVLLPLSLLSKVLFKNHQTLEQAIIRKEI